MASPHSLHTKAVICEKPGNRLADSHWGQMALPRSSVNSISVKARCSPSVGPGSDDSAAFVAHDVGVIAANDAVQAPGAIRLAEIGVRKGRPYDIIRVHTLSVMERERDVSKAWLAGDASVTLARSGLRTAHAHSFFLGSGPSPAAFGRHCEPLTAVFLTCGFNELSRPGARLHSVGDRSMLAAGRELKMKILVPLGAV